LKGSNFEGEPPKILSFIFFKKFRKHYYAEAFRATTLQGELPKLPSNFNSQKQLILFFNDFFRLEMNNFVGRGGRRAPKSPSHFTFQKKKEENKISCYCC
jgi:hypothetical protein